MALEFLGQESDSILEKNMRVQVPHRIPIPRTRIRLPEVPRNRREDQQNKVVPETECLPLSPFHKRQDNQIMEGFREVAESGGREQSFP